MRKNRGFTLFELLIVLSIFVIMTTVLVANQRKFGNNIVIESVAQDMALSVRQAQAYGLGSKYTITGSNSGSFDYPYGIYVDQSSNNQYVLFADSYPANNPNGGNGYDMINGNITQTKDTLIQIDTLPAPNMISYFCVVPAGGAQQCSNKSTITGMSITFVRPDPTAIIIAGGNSYSEAKICVTSTQSTAVREVHVLASGQVEVLDTCN